MFFGSGMIIAIIRWTTFFNDSWIGAKGDQIWHGNPLDIWNVVEPSIYLLSACMLTFRALFRNIHSPSSIYSWLKSPMSRGSSGRRTVEEATKRQFVRMGRNRSSSEDSTAVPFAASSPTHNGVSRAERGEAIELGTIGEGNIQVEQSFEVAYPKKALV